MERPWPDKQNCVWLSGGGDITTSKSEIDKKRVGKKGRSKSEGFLGSVIEHNPV